jgi:hypothetical protein
VTILQGVNIIPKMVSEFVILFSTFGGFILILRGSEIHISFWWIVAIILISGIVFWLIFGSGIYEIYG